MRRISFVFAFALLALASSTCGGTQEPVPGCVPGQSVACAGNAGCAGSQVCKPDGTFGVCDCGTPVADGGVPLPPVPDGATPDGAAPDGATPDSAAPDGAPRADAGTDADAGPFSPDQLDLAVWLDAEKGIVPDVTYPSRIKRWLDQSGHGNNAETASCGSGDPLSCMPRIDPKAIAGYDAVEQGTATFTIADSPSMRWGTGDWALVLVGKVPSSTGNSLFWSRDGSGASGGLSIRFVGALLELWVGPARNTTLAIPSSTTFELVIARGQKNELSIGSSTATGPQTTADLDTCVGCTTRLLSRTRLGVAEFIAVRGGLTDPQVAQVTAYYKAKYGLP